MAKVKLLCPLSPSNVCGEMLRKVLGPATDAMHIYGGAPSWKVMLLTDAATLHTRMDAKMCLTIQEVVAALEMQET